MKIIILLFLLQLQTIFACYEVYTNGTRPNYRYSYRRYSYETVIRNSTITCSNIYSISEIYYSYQDRLYDQFLNITDSNVTTIHPNELASFSTIVKLYLSNIHIKDILPGAFTGLSSLKELYLNNNELTQLSRGVLNSLQKLEVLDLSNNRLYQIESMALSGVSSLRCVSFKNNNLSRVDDDLFDKLNHLSYLDLSENPLEKLSVKGLTSLDSLILTQAELTRVEDLSNLTMKNLNLSSNHIKSVNFSQFPKVENLDLSNNEIVLLENCEALDSENVNLGSNHIKSIEGGFKGLKILNLWNNDLEIVNSSLVNQSRGLTYLDLSYNKIHTIENDTFSNLSSLRTLNLPKNNLTKIDINLFRNLTDLMYLNLSYNSIQEFQYGTFDTLTELLILDISFNNLTDLHQYVFNSLSCLIHFYFDYNQISKFDSIDLKNHLTSLRYISLDGNPWKCEDLVKISRSFTDSNISIIAGERYDVENFKGIACQKNKFSGLNQTNFTIPVDEITKNVAKIVNETVSDTLQRFLNDNFKIPTRFDETNLTKLLDAYQQNLKESDQKLVAFESKSEPSNHSNSGLLVFSVVLQIIICVLLVLIIYFMYSSMKRSKVEPRPQLLENFDD